MVVVFGTIGDGFRRLLTFPSIFKSDRARIQVSRFRQAGTRSDQATRGRIFEQGCSNTEFGWTKGGKMNFSLKPHPLIAHWIPGMVILTFLVLFHFHGSYSAFLKDYAGNGSSVTITIFLLSVGAFLIGEVLDSFRDGVIEPFWNWLAKKNGKNAITWDFFWKVSPEKGGQFDDYYFTYYVFNMNLSLALFLDLLFFWMAKILFPTKLPNFPSWLVSVVFFLCILILLRDARELRKDIARITTEEMMRVSEEKVLS
jgi:hypothetical protein